VGSAFAPLERRANFAVAALVAVILADLFSIYADAGEVELMNRVIEGEVVTLEEADASDTRVGIAGILLLAALVVATITFIVWFSRAYKNLPALGATGLRHGAGWSIGAWFVPFLNLWRPKQIANDIWRASDPEARPDQGAEWRDKPVPGFLTTWWVLWVVSLYAANVTVRLYLDDETPQDIRRADYADILALWVDIAAAVLAIVVVRKLTRRQAERHARVAGAVPMPAVGSPAAPPPAA
jgi:Domain of unknown function (DUF4328)